MALNESISISTTLIIAFFGVVTFAIGILVGFWLHKKG